MSLALRELRSLLSDRRVIAGLIAASLILGVAGPFNTLDVMGLVPRLGYWACIVGATFSVGAFIGIALEQTFGRRHPVLRHVLVSLATGLPITLLIVLFNLAIFGTEYLGAVNVLETFLSVTFIAAVVELTFSYGSPPRREAQSNPAPLLARLPLEKRGALISLSATDHYVNVVTTKGEELVLIRLADAIAETGDIGLQVHRSHWVAKDQVIKATRKGDRAILTLLNESEIPVSRSYLPAVRAAGFLKD